MTNFERIKAMSVEEMAEKLFSLMESQCNRISVNCASCCFDKMNCCASLESVKKYLESEVQENEN